MRVATFFLLMGLCGQAVATQATKPLPTVAERDASELARARAALSRDDGPAARAIWQALADKGNPVAQRAMGLMYHSWDGVERDPALAVHWFEQKNRDGGS